MKRKYKKVSVAFQGDIDGEHQPIQCLCGYGGYWDFVISIYPDDSETCPECGRQYYFSNKISVYCKDKDR